MGIGNWTTGLVLAGLLCTGCLKRAPSGMEALEAAIEAVDRAWEARTEDLEPVRRALLAAQAIAPESPQVKWRFARLEIAEGLMEPDAERRIGRFASARQHGWSCVVGDTVAASVQLEAGLEAALRRTKPERHPCVTWAYLAWARWYGDFGASAAALDRARFTALDKVGKTLVGEEDRGRVRWATALVRAAEGQPGDLSTIDDPIARIDEVRFGSESADVSHVERLSLRAPEARVYRSWVMTQREAASSNQRR